MGEIPVAPSLRVVAADLGLSKSTVAAALRGDERVAAETRARVQARARELGYRPSLTMAMAGRGRFRAMSAGTRLLMLTSPDRIFRPALVEAAREAGFEPEVVGVVSAETLSALLRRAWNAGVEAVLINGNVGLRHDVLAAIPEWEKFCVLGVGAPLNTPDFPFDVVAVNPFHRVLLAWERVREVGYGRIGFVLLDHGTRLLDDDLRLAAAEMLMRRQGRDAVPIHVYQQRSEHDHPRLAAETVRWVREHRPEAVVAFSRVTYWWLADAGLRMPEGLGFAALHTRTDAPDCVQMSGVELGEREVGRRAMETLRNKVILRQRGFGRPPMRVDLEANWVLGETLVKPGTNVVRRRGGEGGALKAGAASVG